MCELHEKIKKNSKINSIFETMNEFLKFGHCYPKHQIYFVPKSHSKLL
jgi:hypothetical protein